MRRVCNFSWILGEFLLSQECRIWLRLALKPLAVLATLALLLWVGAWFDTQIANQVAHAQSVEFVCPVGMEESNGRCYVPCQPGFDGLGALCFKQCPIGYSLRNGLCAADVLRFGKTFTSLGLGQALICTAGQESIGGLCFRPCPTGFVTEGTGCVTPCPSDAILEGSTCRNATTLEIVVRARAPRLPGVAPSSCPTGLQRIDNACYPSCPAGTTSKGLFCISKCPPEFKDDGDSCARINPTIARAVYNRGLGEPKNGLPIANDATFQVAANGIARLVYQILDDTPATNYPIQIVEGPQQGVLSNNNSSYTPNPGVANVTDRILWKTTDGKHESNVGVLTIVIGQPRTNNSPIALDRTVVVTEETAIAIDVLCTDAEGDELFYQLLTPPQHGAYEWQPPNTVIYTPTVDFVGADSFTFRSHDGQDFSNVSTITLAVGGVNDAPLALGQTISTTRHNNAAVLLSATDVESDTISFSLVTSPTHGALSGELPNLLYTPQRDFVGADSFQFRASDNQGAASVATINLTVLPTNTAPLAESLVLTTEQDTTLAVNLSASDADADELTYALVTSPTNGTLSGEGANLLYIPNAGFTGTDSFTYQSNDGQADSPLATVTIQVTPTPAAAIVAGLVYEDRNGNGKPDGNDLGVSGLLVTLTPVPAMLGSAGTAAELTAFTDAFGVWQIDGVPLGDYTVKVSAAGGGLSLEQPGETTLTVSQRGVQTMQPTVIKVTGRPLFLPLVVR